MLHTRANRSSVAASYSQVSRRNLNAITSAIVGRWHGKSAAAARLFASVFAFVGSVDAESHMRVAGEWNGTRGLAGPLELRI
jgi:hypothetical protein